MPITLPFIYLPNWCHVIAVTIFKGIVIWVKSDWNHSPNTYGRDLFIS